MRVGFVIVALLAATALAAPRGALPLQGARDAPRQMARSLVSSRRRMQELSQQVTSQRGHFRGQQETTTTTAAPTTTTTAAGATTTTTSSGTTTASPAGSGSGVSETPLSECENAYLTKLVEVFGKCGEAFFDTMFSSIDPDNTTAVQGKADACNNTCLPDLFATTVQFATCDSPLVGDMEFFSNYLQLTCGRNQVGDWCFQSFARLDAWGACFDPDRDTESSCTKTQSCRYRSGGCTMRSSNEQFAVMCNDPCINDYLSFMARYFKTEADGTDQAGDLAEGLDYLCMNANGSYCTLAFDDAEYNETGSYKAIADAFCRNDTRSQCLVVASAVDSAKAEKRASNAFAKCANSTTLSDTDKAECLKTLHTALTSSDAQLTSTQFICATKDNTNTANSVYCGTEIFENLVGNTAFLDCDNANAGGTCTSSCDGTLKAAFNSAGCCAYYYGEFSAKPRLPDARIPEIANGPNTSTWTFESAGIQDRPAFADYSACTTTFESKGNYTLCVSTSSRQQSTTTKTLQTEVSWEALADTRRRERLRLALKKDIAASIGLSDDAIISDSLSKSSRMLTIRLSKTKTVQKAGTQYVFTIKATTTAKTNAASTLFDSKAKDGLLTTVTSNNQVRPSNCKNCLADGSSAVVLRPLQAKAANGQPVPTRKQANGVPTTTKKGSSNTTKASNTTVATTKTSSAVAQAAALVVAVAAALLL